MNKKSKKCSICHVSFECAGTTSESNCWCSDYPAIMPLDFSLDCQCPSCLQKSIINSIEDFCSSEDIEALVAKAKPFQNDKPLLENIDYTLEQELYVFSKWYHLKRGFCCNNDCRHCPYPKSEKS